MTAVEESIINRVKLRKLWKHTREDFFLYKIKVEIDFEQKLINNSTIEKYLEGIFCDKLPETVSDNFHKQSCFLFDSLFVVNKSAASYAATCVF